MRTFRGVGTGFDGRLTVEDNHTISQISCHDEVVLHDESSLLRMHDEAFDDPRSDNTLLGVKISARLVYQVDIRWLP